MVTILKDDSETYATLIKTHLRAYNNQFVQNHQFETHYVYITQNQTLLGMIQVSYMWDWLAIKTLTYDSLDVLTLLIQEVWQTFVQDCEGIKSFTPSLKRHQDFLEAGFEQSMTVFYGNVPIYYADYFGKIRAVQLSDYTCIHTKEPNDSFHEEAQARIQAINKPFETNPYDYSEQYVALEGQEFVGGIQADYFLKSVYISRIVTMSSHKGKGIGRALLTRVIDVAKDKNLDYIELGTTSFQAKGFYEKLGFKVVHTRKNNPKGYLSYTLVLTLV